LQEYLSQLTAGYLASTQSTRHLGEGQVSQVGHELPILKQAGRGIDLPLHQVHFAEVLLGSNLAVIDRAAAHFAAAVRRKLEGSARYPDFADGRRRQE